MRSLTVQLFAWKCLFSLLPLIENDVLCYSVPLLKMILFKYNCTCRLDFLCSDMFKFIIVFFFFRQTSKLLTFKIYLRFVNALFSSCIVSTSPTVKATPNSLPDTQMFLRASQHLRLDEANRFSLHVNVCLFVCFLT